MELIERLEEIRQLQEAIESSFYNDGAMTASLFKRDLAEIYKLTSIDITKSIKISISPDEIFNLTKYYKNGPTDSRFGLFRPKAQRNECWRPEYECDFLIGLFLSNFNVVIKCGIPTDKSYKNSAFVYDSQHRMLSVARILMGMKKISKAEFSKQLENYCKINDIGKQEHQGVIELFRWIKETDSDNLDFSYIVENETEYPYISFVKNTKITLEITFATEPVLRRTILYKMNNPETKWSIYRHINSGVWCDGDTTVVDTLVQNNTDNTEYLKTEIKNKFPKLLDKSNTHFRSCLRTHENDDDKMEAFLLSSLIACVDDKNVDVPSKLNFSDVFINQGNIRSQLMLCKEPSDHFPYQHKIKTHIDRAYDDKSELSNDVIKLRNFSFDILKWIDKDVGKTKGLFRAFNKNLKDAIDGTMESLIGESFCENIVSESNRKSLTKHARRLSLSHEDTSHVFFCFLRIIYAKYSTTHNVDVVGKTFLKEFENQVISFVKDSTELETLEILKFDYEKRIQFIIKFCKNATTNTIKQLNHI